jgi:hypothetical protein
MIKIPLKTLIHPVSVPYWKAKGFGLKKYHFIEADRVRFRCSYRKIDGNLLYPFWFEVASKDVFLYNEIPRFKDHTLFIVPESICAKKERIESEKKIEVNPPQFLRPSVRTDSQITWEM